MPPKTPKITLEMFVNHLLELGYSPEAIENTFGIVINQPVVQFVTIVFPTKCMGEFEICAN